MHLKSGGRVIWIVLDSVGIGALPDAGDYLDTGADTLGHICGTFPDIRIPNLRKLGLGCIDGVASSIGAVEHPVGMYGKAAECSRGKDSVTGHWEMIGIETSVPFRTFPDGFPDSIIEAFVREAKVPGVLGNCVDSGTAIIQRLGEEHERTGCPIVYTSQDSVFQIAASEETFGLDRLYQVCQVARELLMGENLMARVIARPFVRAKEPGEALFERTTNRHDYAIDPGNENLLYYLSEAGIPVISVGKINDLFCGKGIARAIRTVSNMDGVDQTVALLKNDPPKGKELIFTNLVEFDSVWGHRRNVSGYREGLEAFDRRLPEIMNAMGEEDLLFITADHGCDPTFTGTDHTREYVPILVWGRKLAPGDLGVRDTFADIGETVGRLLGVRHLPIGTAMELKPQMDDN